MPYLFNDALDDTLLLEQQESFRAGMDEYSRATQLANDATQRLVNCILRDNNAVQTRFGFGSLGAEAAGANPVQGCWYFDKPGTEQVLRCINGAFSYWDGAVWAVAGGFTADVGARLSAAQLVEKLYLTDGVANWRAWDGAAFTDLGNNNAGINGDPPVGALIACTHAGRVFASGKGTVPDTVWASNLLGAGTGDWNHLNFSFRAGEGEGDGVMALASMNKRALAVLNEGSIRVYDTGPEAQTANDFAVLFKAKGVGCVGKRAFAQSGSVVYFYASDGVRTLKPQDVGVSNEFTVSLPLSVRIQPTIDQVNLAAGATITGVRYKHLILFAVPLGAAVTPNYVIVYNERLDAWSGYWTGLTPTVLLVSRFAGVEKLVLADSVGLVSQWKDANDQAAAATFQDNAVDIPTTIRTRATTFGETISLKAPNFWEVYFVETNTMVSIGAYLDESLERTWAENISQGQVFLPVVLPFILPVIKPRPLRRRMDSLNPFREMFLEISATHGKICVRSVALGAFLNTVLNDDNL